MHNNFYIFCYCLYYLIECYDYINKNTENMGETYTTLPMLLFKLYELTEFFGILNSKI